MVKIKNKIKSIGENRILKLDCKNCEQAPSLKSSKCMKDMLTVLEEHVDIDKAVLDGNYVQEYDEKDLSLLKNFVKDLKESIYTALKKTSPKDCRECEEKRKKKIREIWKELKENPRRGLEQLKQYKSETKKKSESGAEKCKICRGKFSEKGLKPAHKSLSKNELIQKIVEAGEKKGKKIFNPTVRPRFLRSKLKLEPMKKAELVDAYEIGASKVRIYYSSERLQHFYFLIPPEYRLSPKYVEILEEVRRKLLKLKGSPDTRRAKKEIEKKGSALMRDICLERELDADNEKINKLSKSLAKFTAGLGIVDNLLSDPKIQDIYVDAPIEKLPVHIYHQDYEECLTNVFLTEEDTQILTSKFRSISGRPFSEANPKIDLNMEDVRITAINKPLSPDGLALAIRRHKSTPWTLPLFIKKDFLTPEAAGLLSLLVDSQASMLITGSRGAGKTSLLGALMIELLPKYRIICLEDTAELPVKKLRKLGHKTQRLQVRPSISGSEIEMNTEETLRTALRLGESVLIMGEVRGPEAKSLYEAMRIGAAGNSVMGTIHGSSAKDVFERVVYDLEIPPSSFKATDAIAVASPIRSRGSIKRTRKLVQITEVGSDWENNPIKEDGFRDLLSYDPKEEKLKTTSQLDDNKSILLKKIAKKWSMKISEVRKNLKLRTKVQRKMVETASETENPELLEPKNIVKSNLRLHSHLEEEIGKGKIDYGEVFSKWNDWLKGV